MLSEEPQAYFTRLANPVYFKSINIWDLKPKKPTTPALQQASFVRIIKHKTSNRKKKHDKL